jgi:DNA end-binding protein Ku
VEATQAIDVRDFVPADEIPWTFFENAYYVEPAKQGFRAYALLREALKESGRVGIGSIVLRQREHLTLASALFRSSPAARCPGDFQRPASG